MVLEMEAKFTLSIIVCELKKDPRHFSVNKSLGVDVIFVRLILHAQLACNHFMHSPCIVQRAPKVGQAVAFLAE